MKRKIIQNLDSSYVVYNEQKMCRIETLYGEKLDDGQLSTSLIICPVSSKVFRLIFQSYVANGAVKVPRFKASNTNPLGAPPVTWHVNDAFKNRKLKAIKSFYYTNDKSFSSRT